MVPGPELQRLAQTARTDDFRRRAARDPRHDDAAASKKRGAELDRHRITIRAGRADDCRALVRLAEMDSTELPPEPRLVAEIDGAVRAALSLRTGDVIADPFHPTAAVVELLRVRAAQLEHGSRSRPRRRVMDLVARLTDSDHDAAGEAT